MITCGEIKAAVRAFWINHDKEKKKAMKNLLEKINNEIQ